MNTNFSDLDFKKGFGSDNHSGAHPKILEALSHANQGHTPSYGTDPISELVIDQFQNAFGTNSEIYFVFNGTAANVLSLQSGLKSFESCICSQVSHLNMDECGAPEFHTGAKLIAIECPNGKINLNEIKKNFIRRGDQHFSQVKMISITQPTELGTLYRPDEILELSQFAKENQLYLHMDGARFVNACHQLNLNFKQLSSDLGIDILSFGGTKNALVGGEAVIIFNDDLKNNFHFLRKQSLQLPSKTRFIAAQFYAFLKNELWKEIAETSLDKANYFAGQIEDLKFVKICYPVESNAIFIQFPQKWTKQLRASSFFYIWDEQEWIARLMTSFDTKKSEIDEFVNILKNLDERHTS